MKACIICARPLSGKQTKHCSERCERSSYSRRRKGWQPGQPVRSRGRQLGWRADLEKRFWSKVAVGDGNPDECWEWQGSRRPNGYGLVSYEGQAIGAHRLVWLVTTGELPPDDLHSCHTCDNPPCVNPSHLFLGTNWSNHLDAQLKGRAAPSLRTVGYQGLAEAILGVRLRIVA